MGDIAKAISRAMKEAKWLSIDYQNQSGEATSYWCAVMDVDSSSRRLFVNAFNHSRIDNSTQGLLEGIYLNFDSIRRASVLDHTTYDCPKALIEKIESSLKDYAWLEFDLYNEKILNYLKQAIIYDSVPYYKETNMIKGIDDEELIKAKKQGVYQLSAPQMAQMCENIDRVARQDIERSFYITELIINLLSISTDRGLFICVYKQLLFDPSKREIVIADQTLFNYEFASDNQETYRHNLRNYLDMEVDDFTNLYLTNSHDAATMLSNVVIRFKESIDERPYLFELQRNYNGAIEREYQAISIAKQLNLLSVPLKAFFGNMDTSQLSRKRVFDIVLLNKKMNVDQLRVIHNALKQPVTYVQGPPGTGKTHSIINLLISCLFNEQTVLVSSNNNKPIDDIYEKLMQQKYQNRDIPLPILRLGNNSKVRESLLKIRSSLILYKHYQVDEEKLSRISLSNRHNLGHINQIIFEYEERLELEESIDALECMMAALENNLKASNHIQIQLSEKRKKLDSMPSYQDEDIQHHVVQANDSLFMWLFYTSIKYLKRLEEPKYKEFIEIIHLEEENEQVSAFNRFIKDDKHLTLLQRVFPIILTTNQSAWRLGPPVPSFNLTIIDEAGQCSIGHSLFSMIRGERLLLVGDQNQLQPVITISPEVNHNLLMKYQIPQAYDYVNNSIIRTMQTVDSISKFVLLRYHYRCHKDIINFSNRKYYDSKLIMSAPDNLGEKALFHLQVDQKVSQRSNNRNTSLQEIEAIIADIKTTKTEETIGVITPFRNQADLIRERIKNENMVNIDVGTVHTFQGDEKDKIYFSAAITANTPPKVFDWVKNNQELINVATTRARKKFVCVCDKKEIARRSNQKNDLNELVQYVSNNGKEITLTPVATSAYVNSMNYRQYNTKKEKELLETINQILSIDGKYIIRTQVKISDVLRRFLDADLSAYAHKAVFDFVLVEKLMNDEIPRLVIELDGDEHQTDINTVKRDQKKEKICVDNHIKLIRIPNDYTRRYMFIKDILRELI